MKKTSLIALIILFTGCGSSLDNSWTNFTAYYNTYYNAKEDFKAGLSRVEEQPIQIDAEELVRPHPSSPLAGEQNFEDAVENAAQILRRFPESKWTDDALLLMGKSYYYLKEYFLARQKFEELLALHSQPALKQDAVIWKGRTLLDIRSYTEGVQFLEKSLSDFAGDWSSDNQAQTQILLAEHHMMLEHWSEALTLLEPSIARIENDALRGRSYFLMGQLFERVNNFNLAFQAYSNVRRNFPSYEYIYWAEIKRAEMARIQGSADLAISLYTKMLKDDKNVDRHPEINYQLAQAYQVKGLFSDADQIYNQILDNPQNVTQKLRTDTYYQLGKLNSEQYQNYKLAAAYFDSSSFEAQQRVEDADKLATAYKRYISLKQETTRIDSLLTLGTLNNSDLQTRLAEIRQQRKEQLRESQNAIQQTNNTLVNVSSEEIYERSEPEPNAAGYGFLNYQNAELVQQERTQFRAVWGNRLLVDNWRRAEAITGTNISENQGEIGDAVSPPVETIAQGDEQLEIDLNDIPRSKEAQKELKNEGLHAEYRLGSLFFLTLEQPDSAAYYYQRVLQDSADADLRAQTLYSLYELYNFEQQPDSSSKYRKIILNEFPNSLYAKRIRDTVEGNKGAVNYSSTDSTAGLIDRVQALVVQRDSVSPDRERAEKFYRLAVENRTSSLAPSIFIEGIREYIRYAKLQDASSSPIDSLKAIPKDSARVESFSGSHWDQVRAWLTEFKALFPNAEQITQVETWARMLDQSKGNKSPITCKALGVEPRILPSKEEFMASVEMPEKIEGMNLSGSIRYRLLITKEGMIESYELLSNPTNLGIEKAYGQAIEESLQFELIMQNDQRVRASCEVEFPIKQ